MRDRLLFGPPTTLGFALELTESMHGIATQQCRAQFQLQGIRKSTPSHVNTVVRGAQELHGPAREHLTPPVCPALQNKTSQESRASSRSCSEVWGSLPRPRTAAPCPLALHHPHHGIQQDGAWRVPQAFCLLAISCAPNINPRMDTRCFVTCLWPFSLTLQLGAGSSLALPLLILVPFPVPCRQSNT